MDLLSSLPDEIIIKIIEYLHLSDLVDVFSVSKDLERISKKEELWEDLCRSRRIPVKREKDSFRNIFKNFYEKEGDVYSWGEGTRDALGHGSTRREKKPKVVSQLLPHNVAEICCGRESSHAILKNGEIFCWGAIRTKYPHFFSSDSHPGRPSKFIWFEERNIEIKEICISEYISLLLGSDGSVWAFGENCDRFIITSGKIKKVKFPITLLSPKKGDERIVHIQTYKTLSMGKFFGCISESGRFYSWGRNNLYQCGHTETTEDVLKPTKVEFFEGVRVKKIALGGYHTLVLTSEGKVYSFGYGKNGQLGIDGSKILENHSSPPRIIQYFEDNEIMIIHISCGHFHSGAIDGRGNCYVWGSVGEGEKKGNYLPVRVDRFVDFSGKSVSLDRGISSFVQFECGWNHCIAKLVYRAPTDDDGYTSKRSVILVWGKSIVGEGGEVSTTPEEVGFLKNKCVWKVVAGYDKNMILTAHRWIPDGEVEECMKCFYRFKMFRRKFHCRNCLGVFDASCSRRKVSDISRFGIDQRVRVCGYCFELIKASKREKNEKLK